jgi:hypothetical protein
MKIVRTDAATDGKVGVEVEAFLELEAGGSVEVTHQQREEV